MLNFRDSAAAIDEPKTARMEQRTKPHVKQQIQQAASLLGVDETTFVTSVALERARLTIAEHERTVLSAKTARRSLPPSMYLPNRPMHYGRPWPCTGHEWRVAPDTTPGPPQISIEPLDPEKHHRAGFSCGTDRLDNFLKRTARKHQAGDFTRVWVATAGGQPQV